MARTKQDIINAMQTDFMANSTLRNMYSFSDTDTFNAKFSSVSLERLLIYIFASASWLLELIFDDFVSEVDTRIANSVVTTIAWYYSKTLAFQNGDALVFNESTSSFGYANIDDAKKIIKYVAVREVIDSSVMKLKIYYSGANKQPLTADQQAAYESYIKTLGAAGTHYIFVSEVPDKLGVNLSIYYDPLILDSAGKRIYDNTYPVVAAINEYLNTIEYGGVLYAAKLIDKIQAVPGVKDLVLTSISHNGSIVNVRKIESVSGAFSYAPDASVIKYQID